MRLVCNGRTANPERQLSEYAQTDDHGKRFVKIFLVLEMRGGGGSNAPSNQTIVKTKNEMARLLLEVGCAFEDISVFIDKVIQVAGIPAVSACLKPRDVATRFLVLRSSPLL